MVAGPAVFLEGTSPPPPPSSLGMGQAVGQVQDFTAPLYRLRYFSFLYLALAAQWGNRGACEILQLHHPASNGPQHLCAARGFSAFFPGPSQDEFVISKLCILASNCHGHHHAV